MAREQCAFCEMNRLEFFSSELEILSFSNVLLVIFFSIWIPHFSSIIWIPPLDVQLYFSIIFWYQMPKTGDHFSSQFQERSQCKWILCFTYYLIIFQLPPKKSVSRCIPLPGWRKPIFNRITMIFKIIKDEENIITYQDRTKTSRSGEKPESNNEISI